jgi:translation initiation factor 1
MKRKDRTGIVYSTDQEFRYEYDTTEEKNTLPSHQQDLRILLDSRNRKGKQVTLITGFIGNDHDLQMLARELKTLCGSGGSAKDGEIIVQGDFREKILKYLTEKRYKVKKAGG